MKTIELAVVAMCTSVLWMRYRPIRCPALPHEFQTSSIAAATSFYTTLGMTIEGEMPGIEIIQVHIVMVRTPDGQGRLELTKFHNPKLVTIVLAVAPPNAQGNRSVMFTVDSVDHTVARLRAHGAELIGEVVTYQDIYRFCYMRGPAGIIVALAEELK